MRTYIHSGGMPCSGNFFGFCKIVIYRPTATTFAIVAVATSICTCLYILTDLRHPTRTTHQKSLPKDMAICTLLKDEAGSVLEWVNFHIKQGFTKIIIYDNNSKDNIRVVLQDYIEDGVVKLVVFPPETCKPEDRACLACLRKNDGVIHSQSACQTAAFQHCVRTEGKSVRWLATIDVDEFMFPCNPDVKTLSKSLEALTTYDITSLVVQCLQFGTNNHWQKLKAGHQILRSHTMRAAYLHLGEPDEMQGELQKVCSQHIYNMSLCHHDGFKHISLASHLHANKVSISGHFPRGHIYFSRRRQHSDDICCNHYAFKSVADALAKAEKNANPLLAAQVQVAMPFFNKVKDEMILRRLSGSDI